MMSLLTLPDDVIEKVLSYITYDEVTRCRLVCRKLNYISQRILNRGMHKVVKYHAHCLQNVKSQLPRRESERRSHPLAQHCAILTCVETHVCMLQMTFMKYIENDLCCFIPGKALDEIYRVIRYVTTESNPGRSSEVLRELRDLSAMAREYFEEKIAPALKIKNSGLTKPSTSVCHQSESGSSQHPASESKLNKLYRFVKELAVQQNALMKEPYILKQKIMDLNKRNSDLEKKSEEHQNMISSQAEMIKEQDVKIDIMKNFMEKHYIAEAHGSKEIKNNCLEIRELNSPGSSQKRKLQPRPCTQSNSGENFKKVKFSDI